MRTFFLPSISFFPSSFVYFTFFLFNCQSLLLLVFNFIIAKMSTPSLSSTGESGLPEGWEIRQSKSRNLPYYFCPATTESTWEPPVGTDSVKLKAFMAKYHTVSPGAAGAAGAAGEQIRASHLLVKHRESRRPSSWKESTITRTKPEALELLRGYQQQITSGERTLADIATTESDCSSARKAGDLGFFKRGDMQKEFETAAFALDVGQVSDVVESASGYHLIQRTA
jgi:NIMA-interacting peptidyl-prolyl cis-trans isomerase 1